MKPYTIIELNGCNFAKRAEECQFDVFDKILNGVLASTAETLSLEMSGLVFYGSYSDKMLLIAENMKEPSVLAANASALFMYLFSSAIAQYELVAPVVEEGIGLDLCERIENLKEFRSTIPFFKVSWSETTYDERVVEDEIVDFKVRAIKYFMLKTIPGNYNTEAEYLEALDNLENRDILLEDEAFKFGHSFTVGDDIESDFYVDLKEKLERHDDIQ